MYNGIPRLSLGTEERKAIELGAVVKRTYMVKNAYRTIDFSCHYFDKDGLEIGYVINDMVELCGLTILDKLRVWADSFKNNPNYRLEYLTLVL